MKILFVGILAAASFSCFAVDDGTYSTKSDAQDVIVIKSNKITLEETRQVGGPGGVNEVELVPYPTVCRTQEKGLIIEETDLDFSYRIESIELVDSNVNDENCLTYVEKYNRILNEEEVEYSIDKNELVKKD